MIFGVRYINGTIKKRIGKWLIISAILMIALIIVFDMAVRPVFEETCAYQCRAIAEDAINKAVLRMLEDEEISYESIVTVKYGQNGSISSIESNIVAMNTIKALSSKKINEAIEGIGEERVGVSLGTASGIEFLYGQGPVMTMGLVPVGHAETQFKSRFVSQGINQTLHSVYMEINAEIAAVAPWFTVSANVSTDIVIAETVIVGNIPENYTNISF